MRVWSLATRRTEYTLGGHTAVVNVVKWGGEGLIYTASSDRTVRVWNAADVRRLSRLALSRPHASPADVAARRAPSFHRASSSAS